jgi:hypothetical protein
VLVVTRYRVPQPAAEAFSGDARQALEVLTARPGCTGGQLGRAIDDPTLWTLTTTWESVGAYRRALSAFEVKLVVVPVMYRAIDEPSAFEELVVWTPSGGIVQHETSLAAQPRRPAHPRSAGGPAAPGPAKGR